MTADQLEELLTVMNSISEGRADAEFKLKQLAPSLARKVIAAEKLMDDVEAVMHGLIVNGSWSQCEVNKLLSEITAYREASK